jgi:hypothetical protein
MSGMIPSLLSIKRDVGVDSETWSGLQLSCAVAALLINRMVSANQNQRMYNFLNIIDRDPQKVIVIVQKSILLKKTIRLGRYFGYWRPSRTNLSLGNPIAPLRRRANIISEPKAIALSSPLGIFVQKDPLPKLPEFGKYVASISGLLGS